MFTETEVGMAIAHGRNIRDLTGQAQAIVNSKNEAIDEAHAEIIRLQNALAVEQANSAGLAAAVNVLKDIAVQAGAQITKPTGKKFKNGKPETGITLVYNKAFDEAARARGLTNVENLRHQAK